MDPTLKKGDWTEDEDRLVVAAQSRLGERWSAIGKFLEGRSECSIKTRWYSVLKPRAAKIIESLSESDFHFLSQAPPSQRWKKDVRPFKRIRTEPLHEPSILHASDHHHHMQHIVGSPGEVIVMSHGNDHVLSSVISASVAKPGFT